MAWFKKKPDPISDRARALNEEIAALEAQIQQLDAKRQEASPPAKLRSTAIPHGETIHRAAEPETPAPKLETKNSKLETPNKPHEPIFEEVDQDRLKAKGEVATPDHYNELGVRKYDLPALLRRIRNHFRGPSTNNPKLVHYLAAGGVQGLRPLRYEKRVARNRFLAFVVLLFLTLLGILAVFWRTHR
jgi:cell division protein FtsB